MKYKGNYHNMVPNDINMALLLIVYLLVHGCTRYKCDFFNL